MLNDKFLKIEGEMCGSRVISDLFKVGDRYLFVDIGWPYVDSNPFHWIGKLISDKDGKMIFQDDSFIEEEPEPRIFTITEIAKNDKEYKEVVRWKQGQKNNNITEDTAKAAVEKEFGIHVDIY